MKRFLSIFLAAAALLACTPDPIEDTPYEEGKEDVTDPTTEPEQDPEPEPDPRPVFSTFTLKKAGTLFETIFIGDSTILVKTKAPTYINNIDVEFDAGGATVCVNRKKIKSGAFNTNFTTPVRFDLQNADGFERHYLVSIVPFTDIPCLYVKTTNGASLPDKDVVLNADIYSTTPDGDVSFIGKGHIKGRGNSTWWYSKKPYNIFFDEKVAVLDMPKGKKWCLLANWMDRTLIRNDVAFEISRRTKSLDWEPRGQSVNLYLNGSLKGVYYLCEKIRPNPHRVNIEEVEESGDEISGYILECDIYYDNPWEFYSSMGMPFMVKYPGEEDMDKARLNYIKDYIKTAENLISQPANGKYRNYVDIDTFIDWFLVNELTGNSEPNHPKSCYMNKSRDGKLKAGPVWDYDWGTFCLAKRGILTDKAMWYKYFFKDKVFVARLKEKWQESYRDFASIPNYIDEKAAEIRESEKYNHTLWPINQDVNGDENLGFDEAVEQMKKAFTSRLEDVSAAISNL